MDFSGSESGYFDLPVNRDGKANIHIHVCLTVKPNLWPAAYSPCPAPQPAHGSDWLREGHMILARSVPSEVNSWLRNGRGQRPAPK